MWRKACIKFAVFCANFFWSINSSSYLNSRMFSGAKDVKILNTSFRLSTVNCLRVCEKPVTSAAAAVTDTEVQ